MDDGAVPLARSKARPPPNLLTGTQIQHHRLLGIRLKNTNGIVDPALDYALALQFGSGRVEGLMDFGVVGRCSGPITSLAMDEGSEPLPLLDMPFANQRGHRLAQRGP